MLDRLRERILAADGDRRLLLRVEAARTDYYLYRSDARCSVVAAAARLLIDDEPLATAETLWARGRLYRALAAAHSVHDDGGELSADRLHHALDDLHRAGFHAEADLSEALVLTSRCTELRDDYEDARDVVAGCVDRLRAAGSSYVDVALGSLVLLDQMTGDTEAVRDGLAGLGRIASQRPLHPLADDLRFHTDAVARLAREGPTPALVAMLDGRLRSMLDRRLPVASALLVALAGVITDDGHVEDAALALARRWATQAALLPPGILHTKQDRTSLLTRIDLLQWHDDAAVAAVEADLEIARRSRRRRDVGRRAVRAAVAARRVGRDDLADRLFREALDALPPTDQRTLGENSYVALAVAARAGEPARPPRLQLLGPSVTVTKSPQRAVVGWSDGVSVEDDAGRRPLSTALARLVVALVANGGAASVDGLIDSLWPDADLVVGRARLRVILHRLRRSMDDGHGGDAIVRRGNRLALARRIEVDVTCFEQLAASDDPADRRAALELYRGDVAGVQLAYDDVAAPLRRRVLAMWCALAAAALDDPELPTSTLEHIVALARCGATTDPVMADICARAEERLLAPLKRR